MSQGEVKDNEAVAAQRALSFLKKHIELLDRAFQEGDLHTADMLCALCRDALTKVHQYVVSLLRSSKTQSAYEWDYVVRGGQGE